jgi:hypothetical protein
MAGMDMMLKSLGIDFDGLKLQAVQMGDAFKSLVEGQRRIEAMLQTICFKLEIEIPLTDADRALAVQGTQIYLQQIASAGNGKTING